MASRCPRAVGSWLKRGLRNHHWLDGADFLGEDCLTSAALYDLGPYPAAKPEASLGIEVAVFRVDARLLAGLRLVHATRFVPAWVYLYNRQGAGSASLIHCTAGAV